MSAMVNSSLSRLVVRACSAFLTLWAAPLFNLFENRLELVGVVLGNVRIEGLP